MRCQRAVCGLLSFALVFMGCRATVSEKPHAIEGARAALKVYPFYEYGDGKYIVAGLDVKVYRQGHPEEVLVMGSTAADRHLIFDDLDPGAYTFEVYAGTEKMLYREVKLEAGKKLTIRIDVKAVEREKRDAELAASSGGGSSVADAIGDVFVVIGEVILVLTVVGLLVVGELLLGDDDEDEHSCPRCGGRCQGHSSLEPERFDRSPLP